MAKTSPSQEEIDRFIDYNNKLNPYPTESALVFLNCVSDYEISDSERCKILERLLSHMFERLEFLEAALIQEPPKVRMEDAQSVRRFTNADLNTCCAALREHNNDINAACTAIREHGLT
jgi:hypothetical protein